MILFRASTWFIYCCITLLNWGKRSDCWDPLPPGYEVLDGPYYGKEDKWWQNWSTWRDLELESIHYNANDSCNAYNVPELKWTQTSYLQVVVLLHDRYIYDRKRHEYTIDKFLNDITSRHGPVDSVLLWSSYPNLGIDDRNQYDMLRTLPQGLQGLKKLIQQFHERNIKVIMPYNPWDTDTRAEPQFLHLNRLQSDINSMKSLMEELDFDGFNGDTMYTVPPIFYDCTKPKALCPEGGTSTANLPYNSMSWGYFNGYSRFPPVAKAKVLDTRHMVTICDRWSLNRIPDVQTSFFNGVGYVIWENVWGVYNAISARESEGIKRVFKILRQFSFTTSSPTFRPYHTMPTPKLHMSSFPALEKGIVLFTIISTSDSDINTTVCVPAFEFINATIYDVYNGIQVGCVNNSRYMNESNANCINVMVSIEAFGFGAIAIIGSDSTSITLSKLESFLTEMQHLTSHKPLKSISNDRRPLLQQVIQKSTAILHTKMQVSTAADEAISTKNMVYIPGTSEWGFNVSNVQIEPIKAWTPNSKVYGVGVQYPWEDRPYNVHYKLLSISGFYMDQNPVTNVQYYNFIQASGYSPADATNFLVHWRQREGSFIKHWRYDIAPSGQLASDIKQLNGNGVKSIAHNPVVYVSIEDATAYAQYYRKRLPHDWEWQYAASNGDSNTIYPWGNEDTRQNTTACTRHDVCGLIHTVWQMTDHLCDDHSCYLLLRGGSPYLPIASTGMDPNWYFPTVQTVRQHNKYFTISESYDRAKSIGFRCVVDVKPKSFF